MIHDHTSYVIGGKLLKDLIATASDKTRHAVAIETNRIIGCLVWTDGDISLEQVKTNAMRDQVMEYLETEGDEFEHGMSIINEAVTDAVHLVMDKIRIDRKLQKK